MEQENLTISEYNEAVLEDAYKQLVEATRHLKMAATGISEAGRYMNKCKEAAEEFMGKIRK